MIQSAPLESSHFAALQAVNARYRLTMAKTQAWIANGRPA
jgi:hypothetical protein